MFNNQAANIKLYVALNEPHQYKPKSESRSDIVFLGSFHKIPAEKYPPKDNHHYHKKQLDDLTRLLKRVSSSQALAGRIERYEVRHPLSADVLSLCRIPKCPTGSNSEWREPRLRELEGFLQIGDIRYPYMYASTIRGIEERQRKLAATYYGTIRRYRTNPINNVEAFLKDCLYEAFSIIVTRQKQGEQSKFGTGIEVIPALEPTSKRYLVMIRVPFFNPDGDKTSDR